MGGTNESILQSDKGENKKGETGTILYPDPIEIPTPIIPEVRFPVNVVPMQTQAIRQHMHNGQVHLHVDAPRPLKAAVPVAEWYVILRHLRSLNQFTFVDAENKCILYLKPYVQGGVFEVAIELAPIEIGVRFRDMNLVTSRK